MRARIGLDRVALERVTLAVAAPLLALVVAAAFSSVALLISGNSPLQTFQSMASFGVKPASIVQILNKSTTYYLSGLAVAIGFRMNLFNIGVDGQYRIAAFFAAVVGGALALPGPLQILVIVLVAAVVGGLWAGIAAVLKVTRGVSEVISTIMLNFIAGGIVAYLLNPQRLAIRQGTQLINTRPIPHNSWLPGIPLSGGDVVGFIFIAALCGVAYSVLLNRTRFGYDLRATGLSESAAVASGVDVRKMVLVTMLISGAVAGLVGLPTLLGESHSYGQDFPTGYGFTGIAIALLGRNNPIGIGLGALLWSFLEQSSQILDLEGVPKEIVTIMQGVTVLSVVIAYELVHRFSLVQQQRRVGAELPAATGSAEPVGIQGEREGGPR